MQLIEWAKQFLTYRYQGELLQKEGFLLCKHKKCFISEDLSATKTTFFDDNTILISLNNDDNISFLEQHWNDFIVHKVQIYFVNLKTENYWTVIPQLHHKVADPKTLKKGLLSLSHNAN